MKLLTLAYQSGQTDYSQSHGTTTMNIENVTSLMISLKGVAKRAPWLTLAQCDALLEMEIGRMKGREPNIQNGSPLFSLSNRGLVRFDYGKPWPIVTRAGHFVVHGYSVGAPIAASSGGER